MATGNNLAAPGSTKYWPEVIPIAEVRDLTNGTLSNIFNFSRLKERNYKARLLGIASTQDANVEARVSWDKQTNERQLVTSAGLPTSEPIAPVREEMNIHATEDLRLDFYPSADTASFALRALWQIVKLKHAIKVGQFKQIKTVQQRLTSVGNDDTNQADRQLVGPRVTCGPDEMLVLLGITSDAPANNCYLLMKRDDDTDYLCLNSGALPGLDALEGCYVPAYDEFMIEALGVSATVGAVNVRYRYGIKELTEEEKKLWNIV